MNGNPNGFSFKGKSIEHNSCYLRHVDSRVWCSVNDGTGAFSGQSTFYVTDPVDATS